MAPLLLALLQSERMMTSTVHPWIYPALVAHRGGGTLAPENTLAALRKGAALGFRGVEFDVMLAREGVPVLMHDDTVNRTTNGTGHVPELSLAELAALDAGSWRDLAFVGEPVPSFAQAAATCIELDLWANVEIKPHVGYDTETGRAVALATRAHWLGIHPLARKPLLSSFSIDALRAAQAAAPELPRGYLVGAIPANWRATLEQLQCVALHCDHKKLTQTLAGQVKDAGYGLFCYTVNDVERGALLRGWGVDAFCTDRLDLFAGPREILA
jgi:glycerophosphoryl diester phosphodiesterase